MSSKTNPGHGRIRVIAGRWRRRVVRFSAAADLRPTPDAARERLFAWIEGRLPGAACLDLFAGSGALGFEAASRGAGRVVMVESGRRQLADLERNRDALGADTIEIVAGDALRYLRSGAGPFDIVFVDPPWRGDLAGRALASLAHDSVLAADGLVCLEHRRRAAPELGSHWRRIRDGRCGDDLVVLLERAPVDTSGPAPDPAG
jgi:16S rRNA (guanine966-N2)-methyltransferase